MRIGRLRLVRFGRPAYDFPHLSPARPTVILPSSLPARPRTLHQRGAAALRPLLATLLLLGGAAAPLLEAPVAQASSLFHVA